MYGLVYLLRNTVNGKIYIGRTKGTLKQRWDAHLKAAFKGGRGGCPKLHAAIRKHGSEAFEKEVLVYAGSEADLNALEIAFIEQYDSTMIGYNIGRGGFDIGPEAHKKRGETLKAMGHRPPVPTQEERIALGKANSERMKGVEPTAATAARSKPCTILGVTYPSIDKAALALNLSVKTVRARILDGRQVDYCWANENKQHSGELPTYTPVVYNGVTYPSLKNACESLGKELGATKQRLKRAGIVITGHSFNLDDLPFDVFATSRYNRKPL